MTGLNGRRTMWNKDLSSRTRYKIRNNSFAIIICHFKCTKSLFYLFLILIKWNLIKIRLGREFKSLQMFPVLDRTGIITPDLQISIVTVTQAEAWSAFWNRIFYFPGTLLIDWARRPIEIIDVHTFVTRTSLSAQVCATQWSEKYEIWTVWSTISNSVNQF